MQFCLSEKASFVNDFRRTYDSLEAAAGRESAAGRLCRNSTEDLNVAEVNALLDGETGPNHELFGRRKRMSLDQKCAYKRCQT
ncbi:MAG: hypothetical protein JWO20_1590 [Candidatus Angelobacter sp.]|jgi:hypothetical protein|nr:hypothetical protein [Candidatus Angelobacter sp.]